MKMFVKTAAVILAMTGALTASGLPVLTGGLQDFEYTVNSQFTGYNPGGAAVSLFNSVVLLYGTPTGANPRLLEIINVSNADVCYSTTCPSSTPAYPQPNFTLNVGQLLFTPNSIQAGTGVTSVNMDFPLAGDIGPISGPFVNVTADGMPVLYTGDDPGGLTSYAYFVNADGTVSNTLHVSANDAGSAFIEGVILDPPGSLTLDILGFTNPGANSFVTSTTPEPASWMMGGAGLVLLSISVLRRARRISSLTVGVRLRAER